MKPTRLALMLILAVAAAPVQVQDAVPASGLRVALMQQPFVPNGTSRGPTTMAEGGIQEALAALGADTRVQEIGLTAEQEPEYGGWKRLGYALGHLGRAVATNERKGWFNVGLLGTCPSMPGMVAGFQHSGPTDEPLTIGLLWLDAHPDYNTPETTRSGSLGGMPVAVATGLCLRNLRLDAGLDPPLSDEHVVMGGVRLTDPLEQDLLDQSRIRQLSVEDLQTISPAVAEQMDRLSALTDKIYVHIDMDVLAPREVEGHGNKVPGGPSSEELERLFEWIFSRYPKAVGIGFATIPSRDPDGLSLAALNRMILGAVRGLEARQQDVGYARPEMLVDADWVQAHGNDPNVRVVDLRPRGYDAGHVPGAVHLANADIRVADRPPTFVPSVDEFEALMARLGITDDTRVIAYDSRGGIYAARLWWILNYFGHSNVALLDGGWRKWAADQRPTTTEAPEARSGRFTARPNAAWVATAEQVVDAIDDPDVEIVDARTVAEIEGRELRGIRRGGAIPSSVPVYWEDTFDAGTHLLKPAADLLALFTDQGIEPDDEVITYCQVGMRASHDLFVLKLLGYDQLRNYYGSWEEWGNRDDLPIKK